MDSAAIPPGKLPVVTQPYIPSDVNLSTKTKYGCLKQALEINPAPREVILFFVFLLMRIIFGEILKYFGEIGSF